LYIIVYRKCVKIYCSSLGYDVTWVSKAGEAMQRDIYLDVSKNKRPNVAIKKTMSP